MKATVAAVILAAVVLVLASGYLGGSLPLAAVAGPVLAAVLAYLFNGEQNRDFEKRRTAYHAKLEAYRAMNDAVARASTNLLYLKTALGTLLSPPAMDADESLQPEIVRAHVQLAFARDDEALLEGGGIYLRLDEWEDLLKEHGASLRDDAGRDAAREWVGTTYLTLTVTRARLVEFHLRKFTEAFYAADILTADGAVEKKAAKLVEFMMADVAALFTETDARRLSLEKVAAWSNELAERHETLRDAMQEDLDKTL